MRGSSHARDERARVGAEADGTDRARVDQGGGHGATLGSRDRLQLHDLGAFRAIHDDALSLVPWSPHLELQLLPFAQLNVQRHRTEVVVASKHPSVYRRQH
jgi:hypothetical protein